MTNRVVSPWDFILLCPASLNPHRMKRTSASSQRTSLEAEFGYFWVLQEVVRKRLRFSGLAMPFLRVVEYFSAVMLVVEIAAHERFSEVFAIAYGAALMDGLAAKAIRHQRK